MALSIRIDGISKRYRIGAAPGPGGLPGGRLSDALLGSFRRRRSPQEHVWALRDVSFDIRKGEVVGIVGANGSGKTTLLKILSRITRPTAGRAEVHGRLASLLEVGTGFHAELTGRENIHLNGVTLGMSRQEIRRKFDDIVDFAGVERFIDTPVKRYSSGMYVRLAFAVAAHLEPEILVVDEVLSVGDAAFQKKSLRRMEDVAGSGRTILFVSHSLPAVLGLCTRVVWLKEGRMMADGPPGEVVRQYLASVSQGSGAASLADRTDRTGDGSLRITGVRIQDETGKPLTVAITGDTVEFVVSYAARVRPLRNANFWISVRDNMGRVLVCFWSSLTGENFDDLAPEGEVVCRVPRFPLVPGDYQLDLGASHYRDKADEIRQAVPLEVAPGDFFGTARGHTQVGDFLCDHSWSVAAGAGSTAPLTAADTARRGS